MDVRFIEAKDFKEHGIEVCSPFPFTLGKKGWHAPRFGRIAMEFLEQKNNKAALFIRARSSTGCWIRFSSDGQVRLKGCYLGFARPIRAFDVRIDGEYVDLIAPESKEEFLIEVPFPEKDGFHDFEVLFPHVAELEIYGLEVTPATRFRPIKPLSGPSWLALGDSITQGRNATRPKRVYVQQVADELGLCLKNYGVGGVGIWPELWKEAVEEKADLISIAVGVNDHTQGLGVDIFKERYISLLNHARSFNPDAPILCITPIWREGEEERENRGLFLEDYRDAIREVVDGISDPQIKVVEGTGILTSEPEFLSDSLHPNDLGFDVMARNLKPYVTEALRKG